MNEKPTLKQIEAELSDALYSVGNRRTERGWRLYEITDPDGKIVVTSASRREALEEAYQHYLDNLPQAPLPADFPTMTYERTEVLGNGVERPDLPQEQAPAPVDIAIEAGEFVPKHIVSGDFALLEIIPDVLAEKNECIAELEAALQASRENATELETCVVELKAELARMKAAMIGVSEILTLQAFYGFSGELAEFPDVVAKKLDAFREALSQPQATPVQAEAVTLSAGEIEWLATHQASDGDFYCWSKSEKPDTVWQKLWERDRTHDALYDVFYLRGDFDTPANRAAIAARRAELGLS